MRLVFGSALQNGKLNYFARRQNRLKILMLGPCKCKNRRRLIINYKPIESTCNYSRFEHSECSGWSQILYSFLFLRTLFLFQYSKWALQYNLDGRNLKKHGNTLERTGQ